ncbi:MAG: hypothetical protein LBL74_00410 [Bacteroidales bacterium]|jgi:antitoxin component YwqK of YwqJK toxin-antitoxin module|nr:hypothetical protein [Bacteroidales bacterium]
MKRRISAFIVCILMVFAAFCQNKTDEMGRKQGLWTKFNKKGVKIMEGHFVDGKESGRFLWYYNSGKLRVQTDFPSDKNKKTTTTIFYPSGQIMATGFYVDKKKDSLWTSYSQDGTKLSESHYSKGLKQGVWLVFDKSGKTVGITTYKNDKKEGLNREKMFSEHFFICYYKNDLREGEYKEFCKDSSLWMSGNYKGGKKEGQWFYYDEVGNIEARKTFSQDKMTRFEIALFADTTRFVDVESISYFYTKGKQTIVVLNTGESIGVMKSSNYIIELCDGDYLVRLNAKLNFYASWHAIKGITPADDGKNYYISLEPEPPFKVMTDENSKPAMEYKFLEQEF